MRLTVFRVRFHETRTVGQLYIDNDFFCFTLEDKMRELPGYPVETWKVQDETAIPTGNYKITLEESPRFGPDTLTINQVPGFKGIRIHAGNTEHHTEGCIILGYRLNDDGTIRFGSTRPAVSDLKNKVRQAIAYGQEVWLEIVNMPR